MCNKRRAEAHKSTPYVCPHSHVLGGSEQPCQAFECKEARQNLTACMSMLYLCHIGTICLIVISEKKRRQNPFSIPQDIFENGARNIIFKYVFFWSLQREVNKIAIAEATNNTIYLPFNSEGKKS